MTLPLGHPLPQPTYGRAVTFGRAVKDDAEAEQMQALIRKHFGRDKAESFSRDVAVISEEKWYPFDFVRQFLDLQKDKLRIKAKVTGSVLKLVALFCNYHISSLWYKARSPKKALLAKQRLLKAKLGLTPEKIAVDGCNVIAIELLQ